MLFSNKLTALDKKDFFAINGLYNTTLTLLLEIQGSDCRTFRILSERSTI